VFDTKTPAGLARWLGAEFSAQPGTTGSVESEVDSLERLFLDAVFTDKILEMRAMLKAVAALRPSFEATAELEEPSLPVTLSAGTAEPRLICIPTPTANGGVQQYVSLAAHFRGSREVLALPLTGFAAGERLPANPEVAVRSVAESALLAADGHPFVMLGHSAGGSLAYAAAAMIESTWGITPAAIVLLDTLSFKHGADEGVDFGDLVRLNFALLAQSPIRLTNSRLSAMGRWMTVLDSLEVKPTSAPVLEVRCTKPVTEGQDVSALLDRGPLVEAATIRLIDADHVSLAQEDSAATAKIIEEWLSSAEVTPR
jgi:pimeloyl-ACP methyl ester carboxylesterase